MQKGYDDPVFQIIFSLLRTAHSDDSPLPAAEILYNEGWLLRLVIALEASGTSCLPVQFDQGARWFSEPLLYSAFAARDRSDELAESHTHADAVVGHIAIADGAKRGLELAPNAKQFVVLEAKMYSKLQSGTTNAPGYDQAVRNVACMAQLLRRHGRPLDEFTSLGFFVVAPQETVATHELLLDRQHMRQKVADRISAYDVAVRDELQHWKREWFDPLLERIRIDTVAWEDIIPRVEQHASDTGFALRQFYERCEQFNRPHRTEIRRGRPDMPEYGETYLFEGQLVQVVGAGGRNSRVVRNDHPGPYFPRLRKVPNEALEGIEDRPPRLPVPAHPVQGQVYEWVPPVGENPQPPRKATVPDAPPKPVRVLTPGWQTSAVSEVDDAETDVGEMFHVFTHHLRPLRDH